MVCNVEFFNPVHMGRAENWYTPSDIEMLVLIV